LALTSPEDKRFSFVGLSFDAGEDLRVSVNRLEELGDPTFCEETRTRVGVVAGDLPALALRPLPGEGTPFLIV
jgi:hypothetical protein